MKHLRKRCTDLVERHVAGDCGVPGLDGTVGALGQRLETVASGVGPQEGQLQQVTLRIKDNFIDLVMSSLRVDYRYQIDWPNTSAEAQKANGAYAVNFCIAVVLEAVQNRIGDFRSKRLD